MKQTAGSLRLDLAQYRELEAFSQFASDLDAVTRKQLERGQRLMEVIKQGAGVPLPVAFQVAIIYAGVNGYLDKIPRTQVKDFEQRLFEGLQSSHQDFVDQLNKEKALTDPLKQSLNNILTELQERITA
jgi:F-type H+-transporting ATPase subunit alpha